ncbi:MAG: FecR domain-containing protein, partial [Chloroflexota bacterium]
MNKKLAKALDQCLTRIRRGETIESCLQDYAGMQEELAPLIFTALDLSAIPIVTAVPGFRRASKKRLLTLLREEAARKTTVPYWLKDAMQTPAILWQHLSLTIAPMQKVFIPVFLIFSLIIVGFLGMSQILSVPALAAQCTVSVLSGSIDVQAEGVTGWLPGKDGMTLTVGTRIRTAVDSHALLTFFEGSTIRMEPGTDIEIKEMARDEEEHITIVVMQYVGRTWSRVVKMAETGSRYSIDTPTASAMVRGTLFATEVEADGMTRVATTEGLVSVSAQGEEVFLPPQQETSVASGTAPAPVTTTPEPKATIRLNIDHPAVASIIDPTGASTGNLPGGISFNQIPGSQSTAPGSDSQVITIPHPIGGEYTVALRYLTAGSTHFIVQGMSDSRVAFNYGGVYEGRIDGGWLIKFKVQVEDGKITGS